MTRQQGNNIDVQEDDRLGRYILMFCRTLRRAGLRIGTGQVIDALQAVSAVGLERREDVCRALRAVLTSDPKDFRLFQQAFQAYFRNPRLLQRALELLMPEPVPRREGTAEPALRRLLEALSRPDGEAIEDPAPEVDRSASWSNRETLRHRDFEQMTLEEQAEAREMLRKEPHLLRPIETRRFRPALNGQRYDLRRSMQSMLRMNGQLLQLARKERSKRAPVVVLICDISGSMSRYSRMFLHFAHALRTANPAVHCFVFGTRLTNISRRLRDSDADRALEQIARDVRDWDGGTRIAASLERFNREWSRRLLAQNAVVILLSDGLERDSDSNLELEMQRLHRSCRQLVWVNPVLRYAGFEPKAMGIRKMLPHVDYFLPVHNLHSLAELGRLLRERRHTPMALA